MSSEVQHEISETVIRDLEIGRSAKWLPDYVQFAKKYWDPQYKPSLPVVEHLTRNEGAIAKFGARVRELIVYRNSISPFSRVMFKPTQEVWTPQIPLPGTDELYTLVQIVGTALSDFAPHGSYLLFKGVEVPCEGDFIVISNGDFLEVGTLKLDQDCFCLDTGEAITLSQVKGHLVGVFYTPSNPVFVSGQSIVWNAGEAIRLRRNT